MSLEYKIAEIVGEERDKVFHVVRVTARGRKTMAKVDTDVAEYSQPEAWLASCEEWLNLVGKQGWKLVSAHHVGEYRVRYTLKRGEGGAQTAKPKEKSITQQITDQVAGKAVKSVLKIP